jgi:hypothetical protein
VTKGPKIMPFEAAGQEVHSLNAHAGRVVCVVFSPDGQALGSASDDKTVKIWDARTGRETLTFKGHSEGVSSVAFSPTREADPRREPSPATASIPSRESCVSWGTPIRNRDSNPPNSAKGNIAVPTLTPRPIDSNESTRLVCLPGLSLSPARKISNLGGSHLPSLWTAEMFYRSMRHGSVGTGTPSRHDTQCGDSSSPFAPRSPEMLRRPAPGSVPYPPFSYGPPRDFPHPPCHAWTVH